ncbi:hypothetical protein EYF80_061853 [Liparis tanakae]|uniref:Uncharacterized protein n=1 Tax=Liparis tanakae TaxID=230148 RepID=A0A4Z2EGJ1_9TELE|nr:hypothetical protein EYF80_061853 [Liparis tanakae]
MKCWRRTEHLLWWAVCPRRRSEPKAEAQLLGSGSAASGPRDVFNNTEWALPPITTRYKRPVSAVGQMLQRLRSSQLIRFLGSGRLELFSLHMWTEHSSNAAQDTFLKLGLCDAHSLEFERD